jgi:hypothetical protein
LNPIGLKSEMTLYRKREVGRLKRLLIRLQYPRLQMALIISLTGEFGFILSYFLLQVGFYSLWLRYAIAVLCAYAVFLGLLWCWLRFRGKEILDGVDFPIPDPPTGGGGPHEIYEGFKGGGGQFGGGGATGSLDESVSEPVDVVPDSLPGSACLDFDLEELGVILVILIALLGALFASFWIVYAAPVFLAELLFDVALAAGLYKHIKNIETSHWLATAMKKTILPIIVIGILFVAAGALIQNQFPEAHSIGDVWGTKKLAK